MMTPRSRILAIVLAQGCAPSVALPADGDEVGTVAMTSSSTGAAESTTTSVDPAATSTSVGSSSSGGEASSSTGENFTGPGCKPPPACDRGELAGSVRLESAFDVDQIAGYTSVTGWIEIHQTDLVCLSFLDCLEAVGHDLTIYGNEELRDLSGTDNLVALGTSAADEGEGALTISTNNALTDLDGFNRLVRVPGSLVISNNDALTTITGLTGLGVIDRDLSVIRNEDLTDVDPLQSITVVTGACFINHNPALCMSDVYAVCGDLTAGPTGGNTQNNLSGC